MISYAQNFEDVILWRAFKHIERGFYIDIGAQDPVIDSISLAFYKAGWRGVHVEPTPMYAQALRDARPDETVVQAAIGDANGLLSFFEFAGTGISTGDAEISSRHEAAGFPIINIDVPCITLSSLLKKYQDVDIHWLKIDVEGMELSVLKSWGTAEARPWVVVLESTLPLSQEQSYLPWEDLILDLGYRFVYFDGLNRFYLSNKHEELLQAFDAPPNVFDHFDLSGTASNTFCAGMKSALSQATQDIVDLSAREAERQHVLLERLDASERQLSESSQTYEAQLQKLNRTLSEQVQTNLEHLTKAREANESTKAELLQLTTEIADIRADASRAQVRAFDAVQMIVKDLSSEHRRILEAMSRSVSEREGKLSDAAQALERDLRAQLERLQRRHWRLNGTVEQLQIQLDAANTPWLQRYLRKRRAKTPIVMMPESTVNVSEDYADGKQSLRVKIPGPDEAKRTAQATFSSREGLVSDMPIESRVSTKGANLDALLELEGAAFLKNAYLTILGRLPDAEGSRFFLGRLKSATSKLVVLRNLIESDEARVVRAEHDQLAVDIDRRMPMWMILRRQLSHILKPRKNSQSDLLGNLLARDGHDFLYAAYRALLLRNPDESGLRFYSQEMLAGHSKIDILGRIHQSSERQKLKTAIPGLARRLRQQRIARLPLVGHALKGRQSDGYTAADFLLRRIDHRTGLLASELQVLATDARRSNERIEQRLSDLADKLDRRTTERRVMNSPVENEVDGRLPEFQRGSLAAFPRARTSKNESFRYSTPVVYFYVDHTVQCPVNTGMQRVVRRLGRALLDQGQNTVFVKWNAALNELTLVSQEDLAYLGRWNGPKLSADQLNAYPLAEAAAQPIAYSKVARSWLLVPEVTHITYHEQPVTLTILLAARRLNLSVSFIYYDAIPLRLPNYKDSAQRHELYMQQLLLADVIIPISKRSGREIESFFHAYQASTATKQTICALPLPAESQLTSRLFSSDLSIENDLTILCVGSIEPRKNQIALLKAFESLATAQSNFSWKLILAGHLRGDVAAEVMDFIRRNDNITYVQNISDPELDTLYRACSFTVFPSIEEGFGLPILESLWYAKPCVCANFGAMAEVAEGGGCYSVDTRSVEDLRLALDEMMSSPELRSRLSAEASARPLTTWHDYSDSVIALLQSHLDPARRLQRIYYWIDNTAVNVNNSGIQRVTRQLAKALITLGVELIPVRWNASKHELVEASKSELDHMALWMGPEPDQWSPWVAPTRQTGHSWLLMPELTHGELSNVKRYAKTARLRCAALFYDSIPFKFKSDYGVEFANNHQAYMQDLFGFDAVLPISQFSHEDLVKFYISNSDSREVALHHRIRAKLLPDEFPSSPRQRIYKENLSDRFRALSVVSMEPRKNVLTLLLAFKYAKQRTNKKLQLTLVGRRIPLFAGLAAEVNEQIGEMDDVVWEQDVDDARLEQLYRSSDFTVFPSLEEGYGLPIVESLWNGRPCLCHHAGAMREVAEGGGCILVDMRDAHKLADAMVNFVESPALRTELASQACERQVRSWTDYAVDILSTLADLTPSTTDQVPASISEIIGVHQSLPNLQRRPMLTVSISTYNRAGWLAVALKNLVRLMPVPRPEVEILICDNCSTDDTPEVVEPYRSRSDVRYLRNPVNVGMLGNLRVTSNSARGDYIWILGDDDLPFQGSIDKILNAIRANRDAALIYLNYTYTRETNPGAVLDLDAFLQSGTPVAPSSANQVALVKDIATVNENLFTAIYCIVFRRDHALRAYCQDTSGRPFSTMLTSIPTTAHVLNNMMHEKAVWIGEPQVLVNFNVSWNAYAALQILERVPEALDLAELNGADPEGIDKLRNNLIPGYVHYFEDIFGEDKESNHRYFSILRVISRIRHLDTYRSVAPRLSEIYAKAHAQGHPAAKIEPIDIFERYM